MSLRPLLIQSLTAILLIVSCSAQSAPSIQPKVLNRAFANNGRVRMHLQAGAYQIKAGTEDKIHVEWTAKTSAVDRVKVDLKTTGSDADLTVNVPENADAKVTIELPAKTDLWMRFSAGDFQIEGVEGSKDVAGYAGDLSIDVGDPAQYNDVHASVTTGDLDASAFRVSKGGLFRSFDQKGTGPYTLRVKLRAGDLRLYQRKKQAA